MRTKTCAFTVVMAVCLLSVSTASAVSGPDDLGTIPGGAQAGANAINNGGTIVGYSTTAGGQTHAFSRDPAGAFTDLGTLGGTVSFANAVNDGGTVVGESNVDGNTYHAFIWDPVGGMVDLGTLGGTASSATAVNSSGTVVGWSNVLGDVAVHAFVWDSVGGMVDLGTLGGTSARALGINDAGTVVGTAALTGNSAENAFVWDPVGGMVDLGTLGGNGSIALAVNESGSIVGWSAVADESSIRAFVWDSVGGMRDLGTLSPDGAMTRAFGINDLGQVVGAASPGVNAQEHAFVWDKWKGMQDLGALGSFSYAHDINNNGQVAGYGPNAANTLGRALRWTVDAPDQPESQEMLNAGPGAVVSTDEGDGATATDPVETTVAYAPNTSGTISITETPSAASVPTGYKVFDWHVDITASLASPSEPTTLTFVLDSTLLPSTFDPATFTVFRNGLPVAACVATPPATIAPDPCAEPAVILPDGDLQATVFTSEASVWGFGSPATTVSIGDASILEGEGARVAKFPVTLSQPAPSTLTLQYRIVGSDATGAKKPAAGVDINNLGGVLKTLTFKSSAKSGLTPTVKYISVKVYGDASAESDETFKVVLSNVSAPAALRRSEGLGTIINDDSSAAGITIGVGDSSAVVINRGALKLPIPVTLSAPAAGTSVHYTITPGNATYTLKAIGGGDYGGKITGTLTFLNNATTKYINVPIWANLDPTADKTFTVTLSALSGAGVTMIRDTGTGTIYAQ